MSGRIGATHLARRAVVYVRQSSMAQVWENTESTTRHMPQLRFGLAISPRSRVYPQRALASPSPATKKFSFYMGAFCVH